MNMSFKDGFKITKLNLGETRFHVQIESCRTNAIVCGLTTKDGEKCMDDFSRLAYLTKTTWEEF